MPTLPPKDSRPSPEPQRVEWEPAITPATEAAVNAVLRQWQADIDAGKLIRDPADPTNWLPNPAYQPPED